MNNAPPAVGTVQDGYRFKGGNPAEQSSWEQVGPLDVSATWGAGARQLPNGQIERIGPKGGVTVIQQAGGQTGGNLTEAQGKAVLYGGMMAGGERDYQAARRAGYNPASLRNQIADVADLIPLDGGIVPRWIRDDVSDRGVQAERRWAEGNLRQLTGAAATQGEISRVASINFDRANDNLTDQRYRTRQETFQGTRATAGGGAAQLPEYPTNGLSERLDVDPLTGLPKYEGIAAATAGIGGGYDNSPGSSPSTAIDYTQTPPDQLVALLANGGWVRQGDGEPYQVAAGAVRRSAPGSNDQQVAPGVFQRAPDALLSTENPLDLREGYAKRPDWQQRIAAGVSGFADTATFGLADEAMAGVQALVGKGQRDGQDNSFGARFGRLRQEADGWRSDATSDHPVSGFAGQAAGIVAQPGAAAAAKFAANAPRPIYAATRAAIPGAGLAAAYGFGAGEGGLPDRAGNAVQTGLVGGAVSGVLGPVAPAVTRAVTAPVKRAGLFGGRMAARGLQALGMDGADELIRRTTPDALASGIQRLGQRMGPQQLTQNAARFRAEGIEPTLVDVIDDGGRGLLRANATRQTPARQAAREFTDNRAAGLQDRISTQARRTISADPRSPDQIRQEITARRSSEADQAFGAVRNALVTPEPDVIAALRAPATRSAIEEATTASLNRGDSQTANMLQQLSEGALDNPNGVQITVGMADRLSRSLNGRAETFQRSGNNDAAAAYFSLANRLRGTARQQVPGYDEALNAYAADSRLAGAADIGEGFMSTEADQFSALMAGLSPEERQIAQAAARRAVERTAGTQGQAPGVAQRLSGGREQMMRNAALADDPQALQRAMSAERELVMNARGINPMQGSPTALNQQDAMNAAGAFGVVGDIASGNAPSLIRRVAAGIQSRGFSNQEAEAVVMAAIDPTQTDRLIAMLSQRMPAPEAAQLVAAIRAEVISPNATTAAQ